VAIGLRYIATEPRIFEPGGWFALDGRRVLEAAQAWRGGQSPYTVDGVLYSPVAVALAVPLTYLSAPVVIIGWIATCSAWAAMLVVREVRATPAWAHALAVAGVLLFVPTIADLVLANVTVALICATAVAIRGGTIKSGFVLGIAAAAFPKPMMVPLVIWLIVCRPRAAAGAGFGAVLAVVVSLVSGGMDWWGQFVRLLASGGGVEPDFVGNYGISHFAPELWPIGVGIAVVVFLWCLLRRGKHGSLAAAAATGVFIAPYAGVYAALPILLALPSIAAGRPFLGLVVAALGVVTAPWSPIVASLVLAIGAWGVDDRCDPRS
jgi:hypothetical protein